MTYTAVRKIVIVGGGSAGWLTAAILAAEYKSKRDDVNGLDITLVESKDVATLGVGEGTWPSMRATLKNIGVSESQFLNYCEASFKQGSKFIGWKTGGKESYLHPFNLPIAHGEIELVDYWESNTSKFSFADAVGVQGRLAESQLAPKRLSAEDYSFNVNYGYHLDATKFGHFLREHCTNALGINHIIDHVVSINSGTSGEIASINTKESGSISGDIFVDCSGFAALLIDKHYKVPFKSQSNYLFNDSALAIHVPYEDEDDPIESFTLSTAQSSGWIWDIGLSSRRGVGYTYSSQYCSDENAREELFNYIKSRLGNKSSTSAEPRQIKFKPGYREHFWHKNCVAIGVSAGFIEPLEASALVLIELSAKALANQLPVSKEALPLVAERYNEKFSHHWEQIIEFLKLHYILSDRDDTGYWRDNRSIQSTPEKLTECIELWKHRPPGRYDFSHSEELFPAASYQYVLYGMGFSSSGIKLSRRNDKSDLALKLFNDNHTHGSQLVKVLPSNREFLVNIRGLNKHQE